MTRRMVDFGVNALDPKLPGDDELRAMLAPTHDAPVLLPAHLDLLSQTAPRPIPEPDIGLFLHGKGRGEPQAYVAWRCDLPTDQPELWPEIVSLCRPVSGELLPVPLWSLRQWLMKPQELGTDSDVEGPALTPAAARYTPKGQELDTDSGVEGPPITEKPGTRHETPPFLVWRGRDRSFVHTDPQQIQPHDLVILPVPADPRETEGLGQTLRSQGLGEHFLDLWELAWQQAGRPAVLRLNRTVLAPWVSSCPPLRELVDHLDTEDWNAENLREAIAKVATWQPGPAHAAPLPDWLRKLFAAVRDLRLRDCAEHPAGGWVLRAPAAATQADEIDLFADEDDQTVRVSEQVSLEEHTRQVRLVATVFAKACLEDRDVPPIAEAARWHDAGKLDPRFQAFLRAGSPDLGQPLAKTAAPAPSRGRFHSEIRALGLPENFRHEMLSLQLAERYLHASFDTAARDLVLHLITSHHGFARPFAPVCLDPEPPDVHGMLAGQGLELPARERRTLTPPHRLDSGLADRFWRLTRRYGWWGLAYREAILRLADWYASRHPTGLYELVETLTETAAPHAGPRPGAVRNNVGPKPQSLELSALDGANPLGFLAALGALRVLSRCNPDASFRLHWRPGGGTWRPVLSAFLDITSEHARSRLLQQLVENSLRMEDMFPEPIGQPAGDRLTFPVNTYRRYCLSVSPATAPFAAAWASEANLPEHAKKESEAERTRFDFTAGQQKFVGMLRGLKEKTTHEDLRATLFEGWRYTSESESMRWDPLDEKRQYALQAFDPTNPQKNPPLADRGANFLAVEALPLFPLIPDGNNGQPGFREYDHRLCFLWPMWIHPLSVDSVRTLLTLPLDDGSAWSPARKQALGVTAVFVSQVVQPSGRYRCFTPACALF